MTQLMPTALLKTVAKSGDRMASSYGHFGRRATSFGKNVMPRVALAGCAAAF